MTSTVRCFHLSTFPRFHLVTLVPSARGIAWANVPAVKLLLMRLVTALALQDAVSTAAHVRPLPGPQIDALVVGGFYT